MAKCIKMLDGAEQVIRVPDKMASDLVDAARAEYISKEEWKEAGRVHVKDEWRLNVQNN